MSRSSGNDQQKTLAAAHLRDAIPDVDEALPHTGLVVDDDRRQLLSYLATASDGPIEETAVYQDMVATEATDALTDAVRAGNVSSMQFALGMVDNNKDAADALTTIVDRLAHEGTIAVVAGPAGAGKTATTLDLARMWGARTGGTLIGNTSWDGFDDVVHSDVEMLESMASRQGQCLGVIDETVQSLTGRGADQKEAEAFANRMTLVRKQEREHGQCAKRGSVLAVSHNWGRMNKPTRRLATLVISKPSQHNPDRVVLYESEGGEDSRTKIGEFSGLTDTRESYPEHEASAFDVVLDDGDQEDDDVDVDDVKRDQAIEAALRAVKPWDDDAGVRYADAADIVGYSEGWVTNRVGEWRDGEHRDLIDRDD